jgi:hypothetical protein
MNSPLRRIFRYKAVILTGAILVLVLAAIIFQLGPPGINRGDDRILSTFHLNKASTLYLVARREGGVTDPYDVYLYRVDGCTNVFVAAVDSECAYWWGGNLRSCSAGRVAIRDFAFAEGSYFISDGTVSVSRLGGVPFPLRLIEGDHNPPIPAGIAKNLKSAASRAGTTP